MSTAMTSDVVRFDIPDVAASVRLTHRLSQRWQVELQSTEQCTSLAVALRPEAGDLAALLRDVEAWVAEESLRAIRFELDERAYVLEAGEADWDASSFVLNPAEVEDRRARLLDALESVDFALGELREGRSQPEIQGLRDLREHLTLALRLLG